MEIKEFDILAYLKEKAEKVEKVLTEFFPKPKGYGSRVIEAAFYSLSAGGKRIRPVLCLAGCEAVGGRDEDVVFFAAGIECLHTYSLIHDDLPAMDDDDFRRGKPSCHKAFDEATAILAGDGLQSLAFWFFTHPEQVKRVNKIRLLKAVHLVSQAVGLEGMVGGQMADLLMEGKKAGLKVLKWIHLNKTVKLIEASLLAGALLAKAKKKELQALKSYGKHLGMAFQIVDDLLDIIGDEKNLGKKTFSDIKKQKLTYPSTLGLEKTKDLAEIHTQKAISSLEVLGEKAQPLRAIAEFVLNRVY
ncbi:polyprenyl synthetase family protein [Thermodesulfobacterium sp. TA1]|uniref:polyprenyl synthetase family protein n=1 Tax=Thermodesulfobacterium sp. TA1 TaxID=2234087 RepID=UPI00123213EF|nr:farnesyl diphosphate synthase [Thermodesulfobacterium sp. TA1]QER41725.1 polyprenyl synthetase family protein [Thermodesulfobacterium sp. TA1]